MENSRKEFWHGVRSAMPSIIAAAPFGALFGAIAIDNGMSVFEATVMSLIVFAGASQMVGIELFGANIAPWLIVFSIFAVNFRHILYSAVFGRRTPQFSDVQRYAASFFLVDPHFAEIEKRHETGKAITFPWVMGGGLVWWICWAFATWIGAIFGQSIENPQALGIDFLLPIYFLGIVMGFRKRANWAPVVLASGIGSIAAFHFIGSPWHVSLGAACGIAVAAIMGAPKNHKLVV